MSSDTNTKPCWYEFRNGMNQFFYALEAEAFHTELKVFGFIDPKCKWENIENGAHRHRTIYDKPGCHEARPLKKDEYVPTCRSFLLTDVIEKAIRGIESELKWCDETYGRLTTVEDGIEIIFDQLDWSEVEAILIMYGYDEEWLEQRMELFEKWVQFFYFDQGDLEAIYEDVEER